MTSDHTVKPEIPWKILGWAAAYVGACLLGLYLALNYQIIRRGDIGKVTYIEVQPSEVGKPRCPKRNGGLPLTYSYITAPSVKGPYRIYCHYG